MPAIPISISAYRFATRALAPAIPLALRQRLKNGKEDASRLGERLGIASFDRPAGDLIWVHGASVGETLAVLPLISKLLEKDGRHVLVTSGTLTSARLMAERLPPDAIHQFTPVDTQAAVGRFLDHWKPAIGVFVDSEIWPNMLLESKSRNIPLVLVNGRMSERSFLGWRRAKRMAATILATYDVCLAQDEASAGRLTSLGARRVEIAGNLKADAPPLPADETALQALRDAIGTRPLLLAASTHPGEDETILPAHDQLRQKSPDLLTIIVPRHPARGAELAVLCGTRSARCRSDGTLPDRGTAVYVADTMGELGLFYRLAPFAFVGGSLVPHGGQNPLEPARLHCAVIAGPHTFNFSDAYTAIFSAQGLGLVNSSREIADMAHRFHSDPAFAHSVAEAAARGGETLAGAVARTRDVVEDLLSHARS